MLSKADKLKIVEAIRNHIKQQETRSNLENEGAGQCDINYVLDGGSLLHRVCWEKDCSCQGIANAYAKFISSYYDPVIIVFYAYMLGPSTKDNAHLRRNAKGESEQINFTSEMKLHVTKSSFLANVHNKSKMIQLIGLNLKNAGCIVVYAEEDADVDIAILACKESLSKNITIVGEDSDLLVLQLYSSAIFDSTFKLMFRSGICKCKYENDHNILHYHDLLGKEACVQLLFTYAFSGCDTT